MHFHSMTLALRSERRRILAAACALVLLGAGGFALLRAQQAAPATGSEYKAFTVERIYGQPSLSGRPTTGVEWSPDGKLLSYFQRVGEGRDARMDVWAMDAATGDSKLLVDGEKLRQVMAAPPGPQTQATGLGRQAPQRYVWAPGGDALMFIARDNLYWFDLKTQTARPLLTATKGSVPIHDAKISPDGKWVSFVREHDLHVVSVAGGEVRALTAEGSEEKLNAELDWVYPEELDIRTAYWWAPDSSAIAYLQMDERPVTKYPMVNLLSYTGETEWERYPKAGDANPIVRVGVVPAAGGATRWIDLGSETDNYIARVDWLMDSKRLAIQRLNRAQTKIELLFADLSTGRTHAVLSEEDKYWINLHDDLHFFADGKRFLWSSERDGYRHLYLYDLIGAQIRRLTSGAWEVSGVSCVDENNSAVYFTATEKSPIERHLYRVSLAGGDAARITKEDGTHGINMAPGCAHYLDSYSNTMTPTRQYLYRSDATRVAALNENKVAELDAYKVVAPEFFTVKGADGTPLHAMLIKPYGFNPTKKYPLIVYLYGGPHAQVVRNAWGGANFLWHEMMAQKGFLIFSVDNRGMAGRGHGFETPIDHHFGETELADQVAAVNYLKSLPYVDGSRIGIWGWSFGGYMTCNAMLNAADVFKAGFAGSPVTDWRQYDTIYTERYMGSPKENAEGYKNSSPVNQAAKLRGKLLIAIGTGDDNVHFANTIELGEQFIRAGRYAEVQVYPGRGHGISDPPARVHLFNRVTQFFLDNLK